MRTGEGVWSIATDGVEEASSPTLFACACIPTGIRTLLRAVEEAGSES